MFDSIENMIIKDGYILTNDFSHKWLLSQILRHPSFDEYFVKNRPYSYEWTTALNQIDVMKHLDKTQLKSYERFFNFYVIRNMIKHYTSYMAHYPSELNDMMPIIDKIKKSENYASLAKHLSRFVSSAKMPAKTPKSQAWQTAFKNFGAYTAMRELIMFYDCKMTFFGRTFESHESLLLLETITNENMDMSDGLYNIMKDFIDLNKSVLKTKGILPNERKVKT